MDPYWEKEFRERMRGFSVGAEDPNAIPVSVKVRVVSGCFHREHSPAAYQIIDGAVRALRPSDRFRFEEHESGPELLTWVTLTTAGIAFSAAVINLVAAIIKARSDGKKKGDGPSDPLELIVRGVSKDGKYFEETLIRIPSGQQLTPTEIDALLARAIKARSSKGTRRASLANGAPKKLKAKSPKSS